MSCQCAAGEPIILLQVQECGPFAEDQKFSAVIKSLPSQWLENQSPSEEESLSSNMDNVTFHPDKFELVINVKGYSPQDIRCNVTADKIELMAEQQPKTERGSVGVIQRNRSMNRCYELPQKINPQDAFCFLSSDGILVIVAPWMQ